MTKPLNPLEMIEDPATSYWLKEAIRFSLLRDPVDSLRDAELLLRFCKERWDKIKLEHA